jgi:hypothetical protein
LSLVEVTARAPGTRIRAGPVLRRRFAKKLVTNRSAQMKILLIDTYTRAITVETLQILALARRKLPFPGGQNFVGLGV